MATPNRVKMIGIQGVISPIKLRYLGVAFAPLHVTPPSQNIYQVYGGVEFEVAEQDMAWFLSRRDERGRLMYQVVTPLLPAPQIEAAPQLEIHELENVQPLFAIQDEVVTESVIVAEVADEPIEPVKKTRKNKTVE